jgi:hypothetical protein
MSQVAPRVERPGCYAPCQATDRRDAEPARGLVRVSAAILPCMFVGPRELSTDLNTAQNALSCRAGLRP